MPLHELCPVRWTNMWTHFPTFPATCPPNSLQHGMMGHPACLGWPHLPSHEGDAVSEKPRWAEWIRSFIITSLSVSPSQDFSELKSRTDLSAFMRSWSVVRGTLKRRAASRTERTSLLSGASSYAACACWSCTSFAFEASLLIIVVAFAHAIADGEIAGWPLVYTIPDFLCMLIPVYLHSKHAMKGYLPAWGPIGHRVGHFWPYSAWGARVHGALTSKLDVHINILSQYLQEWVRVNNSASVLAFEEDNTKPHACIGGGDEGITVVSFATHVVF